MNQTFDIDRFGRYFAYLAKVGSRKYFSYMAAVFGVMLVIEIWQVVCGIYDYAYSRHAFDSGAEDPMWATEFSFFMIAFFVVITLAGSMMFTDMGDKSVRLSALMVPASQLEKFVARLIVVLPVTMVLCFIGFEVVDLLRCLVAKVYYPDTDRIHPIGFASDFFEAEVVRVYFGMLLGVQSIYVLGSIVWPKMSWLKTFAALFVLGSIYSLVSFVGATMLLKDGLHYSFDHLEWARNLDWSIVFLTSGIVLALINYTIAYKRLTEIELVQRW